MPKVSVILVNYNGLSYLKPLFDSLKNQTYKNLEIIFVDNGSSDESVKFAREYFPEIKVLETGANLGFTGGNNFGMKQATGDIIVLLNNDTKVEKEWAEEIVKAFEDKSIGITTSKLTYYEKFLPFVFQTEIINTRDILISPESKEIGATLKDIGFENTNYQKLIHEHTHLRSTDEFVTTEKYKLFIPIEPQSKTLKFKAKGNGFIKNQKLRILLGKELVGEFDLDNNFKDFELTLDSKLISKSARYVINNAGTRVYEGSGWTSDLNIDDTDEGQAEIEKEVTGACGCSLGMRREVMNSVGYLDDIYFTYFEDTDYSWRARRKGWKIKYLPKSVVRHIHTGTSSKKNPDLFTYYIQRNRLICLLINGSWISLIKQTVLFHIRVGFLVLRAILSTIKNNSYKEANVKAAKIYLKVLFNIYLNSPRIFIKRFK